MEESRHGQQQRKTETCQILKQVGMVEILTMCRYNTHTLSLVHKYEMLFFLLLLFLVGLESTRSTNGLLNIWESALCATRSIAMGRILYKDRWCGVECGVWVFSLLPLVFHSFRSFVRSNRYRQLIILFNSFVCQRNIKMYVFFVLHIVQLSPWCSSKWTQHLLVVFQASASPVKYSSNIDQMKEKFTILLSRESESAFASRNRMPCCAPIRSHTRTLAHILMACKRFRWAPTCASIQFEYGYSIRSYGKNQINQKTLRELIAWPPMEWMYIFRFHFGSILVCSSLEECACVCVRCARMYSASLGTHDGTKALLCDCCVGRRCVDQRRLSIVSSSIFHFRNGIPRHSPHSAATNSDVQMVIY